MNNNLEFHYVISYSEKYGWQIASDVEQAVMPDGTIYDHNQNAWLSFATNDIETLDLEKYVLLNSALRLLNEGAITNA